MIALQERTASPPLHWRPVANEPQIRSVRRTETRALPVPAEPRGRSVLSLRARIIAGYVLMLGLLLLVFISTL